jgi:hypothetical protein
MVHDHLLFDGCKRTQEATHEDSLTQSLTHSTPDSFSRGLVGLKFHTQDEYREAVARFLVSDVKQLLARWERSAIVDKGRCRKRGMIWQAGQRRSRSDMQMVPSCRCELCLL